MDESKIDYLNNLYAISKDDIGDSLQDLIRDNYDIFKIYIKRLYHVDANFIYLNLVCGVSQNKIAELFGVSQYGVSKRIKSGLYKISNLIKIPEADKSLVQQDLSFFLSEGQFEILYNYYHLRTFALTSRILDLDSNIVNFNIQSAVLNLKNLKDCDSSQSFISCIIKNKDYKLRSIRELERIDFDFYGKILDIQNDSEKYRISKLTAQRYYEYILHLLSTSSYGDYTWKSNDKIRKCSDQFQI